MAEKTMLAPCGIDCAACDIYKAACDPEFAARLAESWKSWEPKAEASWFRCQGCHGDKSVRWCEECKIASCCEEKAIDNCSKCAEFPCGDYLTWIGPYPHHQTAYELLKDMKERNA